MRQLLRIERKVGKWYDFIIAAAAGWARLFLNYALFVANPAGFERQSRSPTGAGVGLPCIIAPLVGQPNGWL